MNWRHALTRLHRSYQRYSAPVGGGTPRRMTVHCCILRTPRSATSLARVRVLPWNSPWRMTESSSRNRVRLFAA